MKQRVLSAAVYAIATLLGIAAFLYPFFMPAVEQNALMGQAHSHDAPLLLSVLVGLCFVALLLQVQSETGGAKIVALVGILVSVNSVLRFLDVGIPGPGGFSPIFALIVLTGYVFGVGTGFLMGSMTLVVSGLMTGTLGPWLPYQALASGWVGMSAGACRPLVRALRGEGRRREALVLAIFGGGWGLLYGAIMNVWFWPFAVGPSDQYWQPGVGWLQTLQRYGMFYVATSLWWDMWRLIGNTAIIMLFGMPLLKVLRRFRRRFSFGYSAAPADAAAPVDAT